MTGRTRRCQRAKLQDAAGRCLECDHLPVWISGVHEIAPRVGDQGSCAGRRRWLRPGHSHSRAVFSSVGVLVLLADWPVMQALTRAADRGVKVRIYLDGKQLAEREPAKVFSDLAETPGVEIRGQAHGQRANAPQELPG